MKSSILHKFILLALFLMSISAVNAQSCGNCTVNITDYNTLSYTVNTGQTFCVDTTGIFEGVITLNGGTVCNKGTFNPNTITFNSGTINNYANMMLDNNFTLNTGAILLSDSSAVTTFRGDFTINGGSFTNNGISNIKNNITFSSGTFSNSAVVNCKLLSGANLAAITDTGIINKN